MNHIDPTSPCHQTAADDAGGASALETAATPASPGSTALPPATAAPEDFRWVDRDGSFHREWLGHLPEALEPAKATLGKYRSVPELAAAHYSLQTLLGKKANAVVPPTEKSTPEEITAFRKALGIPEQPEAYDLKPDQLPEGVAWDEGRGRELAALALQHHVPPAAMKALVGHLVASRAREAQAQLVEQQQQAERAHQANVASLQGLWKADFDRNIALATRAALTVGLDPHHPSLAEPEVVKALARMGGMISEDKLVRGDSGGANGSFHTPAALARDIMTNPQNPMYARYKSGDQDVVDHVRALNRRGGDK